MNRSKYLSYKEAWGRVNAALEADFPFEAVTIEESIISDRLLSHLEGVDPDPKRGVKTSFSRLIGDWKRLAQATRDDEALELADRVDRWRDYRNSVVHSLVKSEPGTPTEDVSDFLGLARRSAQEGAELAKQVSAWHKRKLREAKREDG
jgi:hypothetical protein